MMNIDDLNTLGQRIRGALHAAKRPLTLHEIAQCLGVPRHDVYDAISISLHGWIKAVDGAYSLL